MVFSSLKMKSNVSTPMPATKLKMKPPLAMP